MKSIIYCWLVGVLGVCTVVLSGSLSAQDTVNRETEFATKYAIIFERNIFSRDRQPHQISNEYTPTLIPPAPPVEARYILRGISKERSKTIAFIEQIDLGQIDKYEVGSAIARGHITSLTLDSLTYEIHPEPNAEGPSGYPNTVKVTPVKVGQSLLGQAPGDVGSTGDRFRRDRNLEDRRSRDSGRSSGSTETSLPLNGEDPSEILRRLMERRQRELEN